MKTEDPKLSTYFSNNILLTVCSTVQVLIYCTEFQMNTAISVMVDYFIMVQIVVTPQ